VRLRTNVTHANKRMLQRIVKFSFIALTGYVLGTALVTHADDDTHQSARVPLPKVQIFRGEECVEPEEVMLRDHMDMILHQRDETVHSGIRTSKYSLKQCINCHANPETNSVLGKDGFCVTCHQYAAVSIDCFTCHTSRPEPNAVGLPPLNRLGELMSKSVSETSSTENSLLNQPAEVPVQ
jgi:hypothetical protein